jgi:hypothetical protein
LTPPAATQAGRTEAPHRRRVRQSPRPLAPRRVSGPARGRATRAPAEPLTRPSTARRPLRASIGARADAFVRSLPDHPVLDRLIRGRVWIPLLGVMLAGIVAMQVEVLKLGASMGRSLQANSTLSAQNATLRESVASLADDQRIEQLAASMGMVMPPPSAVGFLSPHGRGVEAKAAANIHQPNPGSFDYLTSGNGAVVTPASLAAWNSSGLLGSSTPSSTSTASAPTATTPTATSPTATTPTATTPTATTPTATTPTASTPTAVAPSSTTSAPTDATPVPAPSSATATDSTAADSTTTDSATTGSSSSSAAPAAGAVAVAPATTQGG